MSVKAVKVCRTVVSQTFKEISDTDDSVTNVVEQLGTTTVKTNEFGDTS